MKGTSNNSKFSRVLLRRRFLRGYFVAIAHVDGGILCSYHACY